MTQHLSDQPQTEQPVNVPAFSGAILGLQGDVLHGWAIDNMYPDQRPAVEIVIDGASVALVRADQYEPNAPAGDQYNGFSVQLRQHWIDGARSITAKIANQSFMLEGQLFLPAAPSKDSASIASQVWHTGGLRIGGWCWDPQAPHRHVKVSVREGNQLIAQAICNTHNQALSYRASSDHGILIDLPWSLADGKVHILDVTNDKEQPLAGSPIRLCCWPEGIEGLVNRLDSTHNESIKQLINTISKEQTLRLPKSASWNSYPQWFEAFQNLSEKSRPPIKGRIGLLLISKGDAALENETIESLRANRSDIYKIAISSPEDLMPALEMLLSAKCDRILPMHAGDTLAAFGLHHISELLDEGSAWAFSDCDHNGPQGERSLPWLKPEWDMDLFIGADIFTAGAIFSSKIVEKSLSLLFNSTSSTNVGWHDLVAAIALTTHHDKATVKHLSRIIYHRSSKAPTSPELEQPSSQRLKAIEWLCKALEPGARVDRVPEYPALLRVRWPLPESLPRVSLIVPTRDQYSLLKTCIEGLLSGTDYPNLEIIVIDNQSTDPDTLNYFEEIIARGVKVLRHPYPFNYSTINNRAAQIASGEFIGLVNNDIEVIDNNWLKEMISHALRPEVGIVGAKLLWKNHMVQHAGVVVGTNGLASHIGNNWSDQDAGYMSFNQICRRASAVTAACMITRLETYMSLDGLDEKRFPVAFNDVDFCMKVLHSGLNIMWTPFAKLIHAESASRGKDISNEKRARAIREQENFTNKWNIGNWMDPYYSSSLGWDYLSGPFGSLALPPRSI